MVFFFFFFKDTIKTHTMLGNPKKNKDHRYHRIHTETKVEMGRSYSKIKGQ